MSTQTFSYTGSDQTFVVPGGVTTITVDCQGAEGGPNQAATVLGGKGGRVVCDLSTMPGETLHITVGQHPTNKNAGYPDGGAGGGTGAADAGGGAGSSDVRQGGTATANRVVIAGGGGGAGGNGTTNVGGSGAGGNGGNGALGSGTTAGVGATTSAGGALGSGGGGGPNGTAGSLAQGGAGGNATRGGGGGGGGYYGGGGGGAGGSPGNEGSGGGGGSGLGTGVNQTLTSAFRSGDGQVVLTWTVTVVNKTKARSTTSGTSFATSSITPAANKLELALVMGQSNVVSAAPTLSGCGLTWVQVASVPFAAGDDRLTLFRAMGSSPSAGAVTATFGTTQTACIIIVDEFTNMDTTGTDGSGAIVQSATNVTAGGASLTVTLAAFGSSSNATYGGFGSGTTSTFTAGSGFTITEQYSSSGPSNAAGSEFKTSNDTSVDATVDLSSMLGIAVEIAQAVSTIVVGTQVTETDTANVGTPQVVVQGTMVTETDVANVGAHVNGGVGARATEVDAANAGSNTTSGVVTFPRLAPSFIPLRG